MNKNKDEWKQKRIEIKKNKNKDEKQKRIEIKKNKNKKEIRKKEKIKDKNKIIILKIIQN
ncbi:hypothetical protein [Methanosarcina mazei]|uniref:hypothetical protein n=1 Tax=Methanosarcina mazei TaxID=2209 RepID=UPI0012D3AA02|nr:hypothetical protein [Methanosarcina mazei]